MRIEKGYRQVTWDVELLVLLSSHRGKRFYSEANAQEGSSRGPKGERVVGPL